MVKIGICGVGFVGGAMVKSFELKGLVLDHDLFAYDKYKDGGIGNFNDLLKTDILFLCLPTPYSDKKRSYQLDPIIETVSKLVDSGYQGAVVIKSTVEPGTTEELVANFPLSYVHNPEFLTARTAFEDFHNQGHIVLGTASNCPLDILNRTMNFYQSLYPQAEISVCSATESECMKIYVNCFYATKVQFFNELYLHTTKKGANYNRVRDLMLKNGWINPMHTDVPGPDGKLSYGGLCFPKDNNALLRQMEKEETPHNVLKAVIKERNEMRTDRDNIV